jgi:hypothetical protein
MFSGLQNGVKAREGFEPSARVASSPARHRPIRSAPTITSTHLSALVRPRRGEATG